jgi:hypothetical protein
MMKNTRYEIRLSKAEKETLKSLAAKANLPLSGYLINAGLNQTIIVSNNKERFLAIRELTISMKAVGNNINQLAQKVNFLAKANKVLLPETAQRIEAEIQKLNEVEQKIFETLLKVE